VKTDRKKVSGRVGSRREGSASLTRDTGGTPKKKKPKSACVWFFSSPQNREGWGLPEIRMVLSGGSTGKSREGIKRWRTEKRISRWGGETVM